MRHTFLVVAVKRRLKSVYIYGSYRKIKTGVPLFWTTLYEFETDDTVRLRAVLESAQCNIYSSRQLFKLAQDAYKRAVPPLNSGAPRCRPLLDAALELGLQVILHKNLFLGVRIA